MRPVAPAGRGALWHDRPMDPGSPGRDGHLSSAGPAGARQMPPLDPTLLPAGVRSRFVRGVNGLDLHVLEAGPGSASDGAPAAPRRCILLLHGFPELAYSWRKVDRKSTRLNSSHVK